MSRVIELIKRFVTDTGQSEPGVDSLQLSNVPRGENGHLVVKMIIALKDGKLSQVFHNCLLSAGIYVDDIFTAITIDGSRVRISEFSYEKKPITSDLITKILQSETIFGLPTILFKNYPIAKLKIFFGANSEPINIKKNIMDQTRVYNSHPFLLSFTKMPFVEFLYVNDRSNLVTIKRPISDYVDVNLMQSLTRHAYTPKVGIKLSSIFPSNYFTSTVPLANWDFLRQQVALLVAEDLANHTKSQVDRISKRIESVQRRSKITHQGTQLGLVPINEVETVLLFQKISLNFPAMLPGGLKVSLLDYSPKDIDSICKFQLSPNHPEETGPVEFEYSLASFFKHGHDYRQVKLIICYTSNPLSFPFSHGGINYALDTSGLLPKLTNTFDKSSIPCLILEKLFK
jgi:hypothetical protein